MVTTDQTVRTEQSFYMSRTSIYVRLYFGESYLTADSIEKFSWNHKNYSFFLPIQVYVVLCVTFTPLLPVAHIFATAMATLQWFEQGQISFLLPCLYKL